MLTSLTVIARIAVAIEVGGRNRIRTECSCYETFQGRKRTGDQLIIRQTARRCCCRRRCRQEREGFRSLGNGGVHTIRSLVLDSGKLYLWIRFLTVSWRTENEKR